MLQNQNRDRLRVSLPSLIAFVLSCSTVLFASDKPQVKIQYFSHPAAPEIADKDRAELEQALNSLAGSATHSFVLKGDRFYLRDVVSGFESARRKEKLAELSLAPTEILTLMDSSNPLVQGLAARLLGYVDTKTGPADSKRIMEKLSEVIRHSKSDSVKEEFVDAIAFSKDFDLLPLLKETALAGGTDSLRDKAAWSFAQIASRREDFADLIEIGKAQTGEGGRRAIEKARALGRDSDLPAFAGVATSLNAPSGARREAMAALNQFHTSTTSGIFLGLARKDPDPRIQSEATWALWGEPSLVPYLIDEATSDRERGHQSGAFKALAMTNTPQVDRFFKQVLYDGNSNKELKSLAVQSLGTAEPSTYERNLLFLLDVLRREGDLNALAPLRILASNRTNRKILAAKIIELADELEITKATLPLVQGLLDMLFSMHLKPEEVVPFLRNLKRISVKLAAATDWELKAKLAGHKEQFAELMVKLWSPSEVRLELTKLFRTSSNLSSNDRMDIERVLRDRTDLHQMLLPTMLENLIDPASNRPRANLVPVLERIRASLPPNQQQELDLKVNGSILQSSAPSNDVCEVLCRIVEKVNDWAIDDDSKLGGHSSQWELGANAALRSLGVLFLVKAAPYCEKADLFTRKWVQKLEGENYQLGPSAEVSNKRYNDRSDQEKAFMEKALRDSQIGEEALARVLKFMGSVQQNGPAKTWESVYSKLFFSLSISELVEAGWVKNREKAMQTLKSNDGFLRSEVEKFQDAMSVPNIGSIFNTYALSAATLGLQGPPPAVVDHLTRLAEKNGDPRRIAYSPDLNSAARSERESAGRAVVLQLALYSNAESDNRAKPKQALITVLENFLKYAPTLRTHALRETDRSAIGGDFWHVGPDGIAPYYYYPALPYATAAVATLLREPNISEDERNQLETIQHELSAQVLSTIDEEGLFRPQAFAIEALAVSAGQKNKAALASDNPLGGLALLPLIKQCNGVDVPPSYGILRRSLPASMSSAPRQSVKPTAGHGDK